MGGVFPQDLGDTTPQSVWKNPLMLGVASILLIGLATGGFILMNKPSDVIDCANAGYDATGETPARCAAGTAGAALPVISGQVASFFSTNVETNVRNGSSTDGTIVVRKLMRSEKVTGIVLLGGKNGMTPWLKLSDGSGYVSMVNLTAAEPPALERDLNQKPWNIEQEVDLLISPAPSSAVVAHLHDREQVIIAGVTSNGYAEVLLAKGGVGYFLVSDANDRGGELHEMATSGRGSIWQSFEIGEGGRHFGGHAADQDITISLFPPPSHWADGQVHYINTVTKKNCSSGLRYIGPSGDADGYLFKQRPIAVGAATCGALLDIIVTGGMEGAINASWVQNGRSVMGPVLLEEESE